MLDTMTRDSKRRWLARNRGFIRELARELDLSHSHISRVYWGKTTSAPVKKAIERRMRQPQGKQRAKALHPQLHD